jgi:hypothetical protein
LQLENKVKVFEVCMLHSCMVTTLFTQLWFACVQHAQYSFSETLFIYTHTAYPHMAFATGKRPEEQRQTSLIIRKRPLCSKKWKLLLKQSHISRFCFATRVIHFLQKCVAKIIISLYFVNREAFVQQVEYVFCVVQMEA